MSGNDFFQKLFYNKKFVLVFSILFAFVFWLVITVSENPTREITFSDLTVSVFTDGTVAGDLGLDVVSMTSQKASVKISGPSYVLSSVSASDISVSMPLSDVTKAGTYDISLVAAIAKSSEVTVVGITPSVVTAVFDYVDSETFDIEVEAEGAVAASGLVAYTPAVSNSDEASVEISGPRAQLLKIKRVVARAQVNKTLSASQSFEADIYLYDEDGNEIDKTPYTIPFDKVSITVPILKQKKVAVNVAFANKPDGYSANDLKYTVSHSSLTLLGPESTIESLDAVSLEPIDFDTLSLSNNTFEVAPVLPNGIRIADNIEKITVSIDTSAFEEKTFNVSKFEFKNVANGLSVTSSGVKNVKICAPKSVAKNLQASDLYAVADLSGKTAGEYTVSVRIYSKAYNNIWQVGSYTVVVTVK